MQVLLQQINLTCLYFCVPQAQYGMDNSMTAGQQLDRDLEQAVFKGKISTAEYHQTKLSQQQSQRSGVDDGSTQVPGEICWLWSWTLNVSSSK